MRSNERLYVYYREQSILDGKESMSSKRSDCKDIWGLDYSFSGLA